MESIFNIFNIPEPFFNFQISMDFKTTESVLIDHNLTFAGLMQ